ncbi:uncharacterized protein CBL_00869 [Carabus blaptoides fortunei]
MVLLAAFLVLHSVGFVGSMPGGPGIPENITVTFLNPTSVKVSWATSMDHVDKYDVTYKPTDASYRVVAVVAGNSEAVTLSGLKADTQYQVTVAAVWGGRKYRSRPIVFRTLEPPRTSPTLEPEVLVTNGPPQQIIEVSAPPPINPEEVPHFNTTVRGVEIGIVLLVLLVWVAAIALFFNRWGKIRMLLPYQPDYKEQLKVPGSAACAAAVAAGNTCNHHSGDHICSQKFRWSSNHVDGEVWSPRRQRSRINSAIFISNSGPGFEAGEFFRRHGSQSRLCRKAHSVDNISDEDQKHFGLPMLSVSGPSPPEDDSAEQTDECL